MRDVDVALSALGEKQGEAAGRWFSALPANERPEIILASPYVRARQTAEIICRQGALAGGPARTIIDERLREREFGIFDRLTTVGIRERFPEEAAHRRRLGKFYHRLRLRSMLNTINLHYCDRRVLVVCHQVVVLCFRYILEELDEETILSIDKQAEILNCGIAAYEFEPDAKGLCVPALELWNYGAPLEAEGTSKTSAPDAMAGTR
jgi:broad specificity phosphatase PhoE